MFRLSQFHLETNSSRWWTTHPPPFFLSEPAKSTSKSKPFFLVWKLLCIFLSGKSEHNGEHNPFSQTRHFISPSYPSYYLVGFVLPPGETKPAEAPQVAPISVEQRPELEDVAIDAGGSRLCRCWHVFFRWYMLPRSFWEGEDEAL